MTTEGTVQPGVRWEESVSTRTSEAVFRALTRFYAIWADSRRARHLARDMGGFEDPGEAPDSEKLFPWNGELCSTPHRRPGSPEGHKGERWVEERFREIGLEDVKVEPVPITVWSARDFSLGADGRDIACFYVPYTGFTGELVYVGKGRRRDAERAGVSGKIAVADVTFSVMPTGMGLKQMKAAYYISDPGACRAKQPPGKTIMDKVSWWPGLDLLRSSYEDSLFSFPHPITAGDIWNLHSLRRLWTVHMNIHSEEQASNPRLMKRSKRSAAFS